jgi:hypothetical protein
LNGREKRYTSKDQPNDLTNVLRRSVETAADSCPFPFPQSRRLNGKSWKKPPLSLGAKKGSRVAAQLLLV